MAMKIGTAAALVLASALVAGCSGLGDNFGPTSALPEPPAVDPACSQLAASIDGLRREGVQDKVEKAAAKKYKMKPADLTKAAQLNRANDDFQARCSNLPRSASTLSVPTAAKAAAVTPKAAAPAIAATEAAPPPAVDTAVRTARASTAAEPAYSPDSISAGSSSSGGN